MIYWGQAGIESETGVALRRGDGRSNYCERGRKGVHQIHGVLQG